MSSLQKHSLTDKLKSLGVKVGTDLAPPKPSVERRDDDRFEEVCRRFEDASLFVAADAPMASIVLGLQTDQGLRSAPEWRPLDVLPPDRPIEHVSQQ